MVSMEVEVSLRARGENEENENDRQAAKPDGVSPSSSVSASDHLERGAISGPPTSAPASLSHRAYKVPANSHLPIQRSRRTYCRHPPTPMSPYTSWSLLRKYGSRSSNGAGRIVVLDPQMLPVPPYSGTISDSGSSSSIGPQAWSVNTSFR